MLQTLGASLILAAISAVSYLAYKHPHAYKKLVKWLSIGLASIYLSLTLWDLVLVIAQNHLVRSIDLEHAIPANAALSNIQVPLLWLSVIYWVSFAYLLGLWFLPNLLEHDKDEEKPKEPSAKKDDDKA